MINIIVITHGEFGAYLIEAAENIVGEQKEGIKSVSVSPRMSLPMIHEKVQEAVEEMRGPEGLICFIDMPGGTPMNVAVPILQNLDKTAAVCGVNLNMVISAFFNRSKYGFEDLIEKVISDGKKAICEVKSLLED